MEQYVEAADRILAVTQKVLARGGSASDVEAAVRRVSADYPRHVLQAARHKLITDGHH
ncbi:hypothetical protein [Streptomyces sp. NPDC012888]|uniref:hypothetical protein n=1 Tax=Streptomyces sp. NPDC012888 TaxID=3364855 RepID=UPI0036C7FA7C